MFFGKVRTFSRKLRLPSRELAPRMRRGESSGTSVVNRPVTSMTAALSGPNASMSNALITGCRVAFRTAR